MFSRMKREWLTRWNVCLLWEKRSCWEFRVEMENKTIDIPRLDYWGGDYVKLNKYLKEQNWDQIMTGDVIESWRLFKDVLMEGINRYIPIRKDQAVKQKKKLPLEIRRGLPERNRLWRRYKVSG